MTSLLSPNGRASWIAMAAMAVIALGVGVAYLQSRVPPEGGPAIPAPAGEATESMIDRALERAAPVDSSAIKQRWVDEVRGVDASDLDVARMELFLRLANVGQCTCGCGYTLAGCRATDMTCEVSGERLAALLDSIRAGHITSARGIRERPRGGR